MPAAAVAATRLYLQQPWTMLMACVKLATLGTFAASAQQGEMLAALLLLLLLYSRSKHRLILQDQCNSMASGSCASRVHEPAHTTYSATSPCSRPTI
jgi:hypothetical protein